MLLDASRLVNFTSHYLEIGYGVTTNDEFATVATGTVGDSDFTVTPPCRTCAGSTRSITSWRRIVASRPQE